MNTPTLTSLTGEIVTNHIVYLEWIAVNHATQYYLYRSSEPFNDTSQLSVYQVFANSSTSFNDSNVPLGNYYYCLVPMTPYGAGNESLLLEVSA